MEDKDILTPEQLNNLFENYETGSEMENEEQYKTRLRVAGYLLGLASSEREPLLPAADKDDKNLDLNNLYDSIQKFLNNNENKNTGEKDRPLGLL